MKGYLAFCSHLVQVWHTVFKMPVGSYDLEASPVFLKQYNSDRIFMRGGE